jgi:uncharacterized protein with PIN domain
MRKTVDPIPQTQCPYCHSAIPDLSSVSSQIEQESLSEKRKWLWFCDSCGRLMTVEIRQQEIITNSLQLAY